MGSDFTQEDREKAQAFVSGALADAGSLRDVEYAVAALLAEERAKTRARVASDLADLVTDSGGTPSRAALVDFIYGLES